MTELSPTQVALRELTMLTKCYCDGEHPRLGHNCSFRPDVLTLVTNIGNVLKLCDERSGLWDDGRIPAEDVRRTLLGLSTGDGGATDDPPWSNEEGEGPSMPG